MNGEKCYTYITKMDDWKLKVQTVVRLEKERNMFVFFVFCIVPFV